MEKVLKNIKNFFKKIYANEYVKAFIWIYLVGLLCFGSRALFNHLTLPMAGDYTLQTYAFYAQGYNIFWDFVKNGEIPLYDFSNFLGANYLGTQSFYYVFSPLFYLLCLTPKAFLYQGIFLHMVFKFAVGGFFMYVLLRKYFNVSFKMSWLGGFIYAFSGWSLFYVWFHFGDAMAFFPLFIIGIERCLKERKGGLLAIATFLCGMSNYFFLVNYCIFGVLYALYRWVHIYGINKKRGFNAATRFGVLLQGVLFCGVGVAMCAVCLLPSLHVVMNSTRTNSSTEFVLNVLQTIFINPSKDANGFIFGEAKSLSDFFKADNLKRLFSVLFLWEDRKIGTTIIPASTNIGYVLSNWIYMNTNCWDNIMFDNAPLDNAIGGFFITTPLTMLLIPSIANAFKTKRPWTIFGVILCLVLPFLPITFHMAFAFTNLYGRWQIWIVLIGILFIIPTLDKYEHVNRKLVTVNLILNLSLAVVVYFISKNDGKLPTNQIINILGLNVPSFILISFIEVLVMIGVWFIYRFKLFSSHFIKKAMMIIVVIEVGASTIITVEQKSYYDWEDFYIAQEEFTELDEVISDIKENDNDFYRIYNNEATRLIVNMPAQLNYNGSSVFHSTYNFNLNDFIKRSRMAYNGSWSMGNHEKRYWFDQYIGTKYHIVDKNDVNNDNYAYNLTDTILGYDNFFDGRSSKNEAKQEYRINVPYGYSLYKEYDNYLVYINENYSGIGYTVDKVMRSKTVSTSYASDYYEELYATHGIIENEDEDYVLENSDVDLKNMYITKYDTYNFYNKWDLYFSPREDVSRFLTNNYERQIYKLSSSKFTKDEISRFIDPNSQFLHKRWEEYGFFGDQFILESKNGELVCKDASEDNICYISLSIKTGAKSLVSFYNDDVLITQDAHMNSNSSLNIDSYEWKNTRGYYIDKPFNKIVIEFVSDASYDKVFNTSGDFLSTNINYIYQNDIDYLNNKVKESLLTDVTYSNNKFTFKSNTTSRELAVTNIPYDDGWTLKANGEDVKIIKVNGGFIGFITEDKETQYTLSYFTPNLKKGIVVSISSFIVFIALFFVYRKKRVSIALIEREIAEFDFKRQEKEELEYLSDKNKKRKK